MNLKSQYGHNNGNFTEKPKIRPPTLIEPAALYFFLSLFPLSSTPFFHLCSFLAFAASSSFLICCSVVLMRHFQCSYVAALCSTYNMSFFSFSFHWKVLLTAPASALEDTSKRDLEKEISALAKSLEPFVMCLLCFHLIWGVNRLEVELFFTPTDKTRNAFPTFTGRAQEQFAHSNYKVLLD